VSDVAEPTAPADPPAGWERLERAVEDVLRELDAWRGRAAQADAEVARLRSALEEAMAALPALAPGDARDQVRRLKAENAALRARVGQAHRRISAMLAWTDALEDTP